MDGSSERPWTLGKAVRGGERAVNAEDASVPWYGLARVVVEVDNETNAPGEANARRIVAAVNATSDLPIEALEADVVRKLVEALGALVQACDRGTIVTKSGFAASGMSIEAQAKASCINGVDLWAVEEARDTLTLAKGEAA